MSADDDPLRAVARRIAVLFREKPEYWIDGVRRWAADPPQHQGGVLPIPLPLRTTTDERIALLAAIHDDCVTAAARIDPWPDPIDLPDTADQSLDFSPAELRPGIRYAILLNNRVPQLRQVWDSHEAAIEIFLAEAANAIADDRSAEPSNLFDRAGKVFDLAWTLGQKFQNEHSEQGPVFMAGVQPPASQRHGELIKEFVAAVLDARDIVRNSPDGVDEVIKQLHEAGKYAKLLDSRMKERANNWDILDLWPDLNTLGHDGCEAVKAARQARRVDDPFAAFEEPKRTEASHAVEATANGQDQAQADKGDLVERLLAGPNDVELTPRELALLEAYLKQPLSMVAIQQDRSAHPKGESETWNRHNKLKLIRDFNRELHGAGGVTAQSSPDNPSAPTPTDATPKRRGRRKADEATVQRESKLAAEWEWARDGGTYKPNFAKDNGMTVKQFDALLDRVAKRKRASD